MSAHSSASAVRVLDELLDRLNKGEAVDVETSIAECAPQERDGLREAVCGALALRYAAGHLDFLLDPQTCERSLQAVHARLASETAQRTT
jgi:hypothetical protein